MELVAIGAKVQIVKPAGRGPKELCADRVAISAGIDDLLTVGLFLFESGRSAQAQLVERRRGEAHLADGTALPALPLDVGVHGTDIVANDETLLEGETVERAGLRTESLLVLVVRAEPEL